MKISWLQIFPGMNQEENAVHCSDLEEDGLLEVEYFFTLMQPYQSVWGLEIYNCLLLGMYVFILFSNKTWLQK